MEQFFRLRGIAAPMLYADIDTDQIIPGPEILRSTEDSHARWGAGLFANWRYLKDREPNPDFVLNQPPYDRSEILLADRNFGCGSPRENAPKALRGFGFRAVIAPSFGDIFYSNCFRNGLLPVKLPIEAVRELVDQTVNAPANRLVEVDLRLQQVVAPNGHVFSFETPELLRNMLLAGKDEVELTLARRVEIEKFRRKDIERRPWAYDVSG